MEKIKNLFLKSKQLTIPSFKRPCLRKTQAPLDAKTSIDHLDTLPPLSSSPTPISPTMVKWVMVHSRFSWFEILIAMSFGIPIALLSVSYEFVGGILVPAKLFTSNPKLFIVFIIFDALAFIASIIGFWLNNVHKRISKYLFLLSFLLLMIAFCVYMRVLLPSYFNWFPLVLFFTVLLVLVYVHVRKGNGDYLEDHHFDSLIPLP